MALISVSMAASARAAGLLFLAQPVFVQRERRQFQKRAVKGSGARRRSVIVPNDLISRTLFRCMCASRRVCIPIDTVFPFRPIAARSSGSCPRSAG